MIEIIPAIDIIDGKCVRLTQGDYTQKTVYNEDPVEVAMMFEDAGIKRLHTVDLDGARSTHVVNTRVIERIATHTNLTIDFGGGIKSDEDLRKAFDAGAQMVTIGSVAVKEPELFASWVETYGGEKIILGADVKNGYISISGWLEEGEQKLMDFICHHTKNGIHNVLCTDISRDGMLQGPAIELYKDIMAHYPTLHLIASGGVSCINDIERLNDAGIPAVVFGKAIYEGRIKLKELERFLC
ncbi:MAG: 1-(5-phosphoribosyl)-5-[Bacteroidaceae bacterium]|nr:1-(5-phosphoribosyl)-5-[(5-phosphoribosylamino)methylideneamino]imidazole-4-carboxamide isomerase [Bacteroidaceae bacterium]